jgi:predicted amidohydrolase
MTRRTLTIAACAPRTYGFVQRHDEGATEDVIAGRLIHRDAIAAHVERMLDHHCRLLRRAGRRGVRLAVIPEDCLRLAGLVARHGRLPECRDRIDEAFARYDARIRALCRHYEMAVVGGTVIPRETGFANTAIMHDAAGRIVATYDKTRLPDTEREVFVPGATLPVFETPLGRVGMLICWDIRFPETYAALADQGAELIVQPTFGHAGDDADSTARGRARDSQVPLVISMWGGPSGNSDASGNYLPQTGRRGNGIAIAELTIGRA